MRKLMCFDGKQCNQGNSFREYRRVAKNNFEAIPDQKGSRHDTHVTHAQTLKNKICVFAKMFFAKLQMTVSPASVKPDATFKESDVPNVNDEMQCYS